MGLKFHIQAKHNHLGIVFEDAYFAISRVNLELQPEGGFSIGYEVSGYTSRDAKIDTVNRKVIPVPDWGGTPVYPCVDAKIYHYYTSVLASEIFPTTIPTDTDQIKTGCYEHFKAHLDESGIEYENVFEELEDASAVTEE